jgi:dipeptide transport system substrate-binding protein
MLFFSFRSFCFVLLISIFPLFSQADDKTFIFCSEASPSHFAPSLNSSGTTLDASQQTVYNTLVEFAPGSQELLPALAERWETLKNGRGYRFYLRKNVSFHTTSYFKPTRFFNADDVLWTFHRQLKKDHPFHQVNGGTYEMVQALELDKTISDVIKIDAHTVEFRLKHPEAPFLSNLALGWASIYSAEYAQQLEKGPFKDKIDFLPVGTGPFSFVRYEKDTLIRFERHPLYFGEKPHIEKLVFSVTPEASVRLQKLKTGECHFMASPSPSDIPLIEKRNDLQLIKQAGLNVGYLAINTQKNVLKNKLVRKAIALSLNREQYIKSIYGGMAYLANGPLPPGILGSQGFDHEFFYDPIQAKELLKKAGVRLPLRLNLWVLPVARPYNPNGKKMGEMMQADLAEVGIQVQLISYDWPTYQALARKGEHDLIQMGWTSDNGDPDNFLGVLLSCSGIESGSNYARWCHPYFDQLILKGKQDHRDLQRLQFYTKALKIFAEEKPWIPLVHSTVVEVLSKKIHNYKMSPLGTHQFKQVQIK